MTDNLSASYVRLRAGTIHDGVVNIAIEGRLDSSTTGQIWRKATETVTAAKARSVIVDAAAVDYCDGSGIALFVHLRNLQHEAGKQLEIHGLRPEFQGLLEESDLGDLKNLQGRRRAETKNTPGRGPAAI